jgi:hypothetical protein
MLQGKFFFLLVGIVWADMPSRSPYLLREFAEWREDTDWCAEFGWGVRCVQNRVQCGTEEKDLVY